MTFQELIFNLQQYWASQGCVIIQPYDQEVGAAHPIQQLSLEPLGLNHGKQPMYNLAAGQKMEGMVKILIACSIIINFRLF